MTVHRVALVVLAVSAALIGGWALVSPRGFYDDFPGFGHHWVSADGPYNEHLVLDVAGLYLALLVLSVGAFAALGATLLRLTGAAWAVFSVVHLAYHAGHLEHLSNTDGVLEVGSLAATLVLALVLLVPARS